LSPLSINPQTSPFDSLGVVLAGVEVGERKKPPNESMDSLGVVVAGIEVGERRKPPNESR
jgi:hypothetical protein